MDRYKIYAASAAAIIFAYLAGSFWYVSRIGSDDIYDSCRTSSVSGGMATIGGPFTLVSETGETVTDVEVFAKPSLVYFGYTFCPDVCPVDAARNADAVDVLAALGHEVQPVFITIDPERDTPELLAEYTDYMHPEMLGLSGTLEQTKAASQAYRTYYQKQPGDDEFYLVDHSTFTYLVLPKVGFVEFFRRDLPAEKMGEQTACFLEIAAKSN